MDLAVGFNVLLYARERAADPSHSHVDWLYNGLDYLLVVLLTAFFTPYAYLIVLLAD